MLLNSAYLVNPTLLPGYLPYGLAEDKNVVDTESRNARDDRFWNNVCAIVGAANSNLEYRSINL